jgi:hypothetical protein
MKREFFDPPIEDLEIVLIGRATIHKAQERVAGCEGCDGDAEILFDWILDEVTGRNPGVTDYLMEVPARCPYCCREIVEKALVLPR